MGELVHSNLQLVMLMISHKNSAHLDWQDEPWGGDEYG